MTVADTDPLPGIARAVLRDLADELRRFPAGLRDDAEEVTKLLNRTASRLDGVARMEPVLPTRDTRRRPAFIAPSAPTVAAFGPGGAKRGAAGSVTVQDGRAVRVETRRVIRPASR